MATTQKIKTVEQAKEWYDRSSGVIFTNYRGLKVQEIHSLRNKLREKGGEIHVIKNTLFRIAAGNAVDALPEEYHNGPTAIAFLFENESECAKILFDFAKQSKKLEVKGGLFDGKPLTNKEVEGLSMLPPKEVLIAQVIGTIIAPITQVIGTIESIYAQPIRAIGAVADKMNKEA